METGTFSKLQNDIKEIIKKLYQNQQDDTYPWIEKHISEIKDSLIEKIAYYEKNGQSNDAIEELAVGILEHLISAYQNHQTIELADCLKYEYVRYMEWETEQYDNF